MTVFTPQSALITCLYYFAINLFLTSDLVYSSKLEDLLEKGTKELVSGRFAEALSLYSDAINEESDNFLPYYKRAMAYLASGKTKSAIPDLDKAIDLKPDYYPAYKTRANAFVKLGELDRAKEDFTKLLQNDVSTARAGIQLVENLRDKYDEAKMLLDHGAHPEALRILDGLVDSISMNKEILEFRAKCHLKTGDLQRGLNDLRNSVHLLNDNRQGLLDISIMMYEYGFVVQSLEEVRECLRLDQDDKACLKHYKKVKKLAKAVTGAQDASDAGNYDQCIKQANQILTLEPDMQVYKNQAEVNLCHCKSQKGVTDAVEDCLKVVEKNPSMHDYLLDLANAYLNRDEFDEAIKTYQKILENDRQNRQAKEGMEKAQRLKRNQSKRDYYKILGVSRNAQKKEITKAYRKLAAQWHPDKFEEKDKKVAEKKFIDITDAKEVLTDDEKRQKFDMGIDPLDPEQAQGGGGGPGGPHPFHFQGGGGGGSFGGFQFDGFNPFENAHGGNFEFHFG